MATHLVSRDTVAYLKQYLSGRFRIWGRRFPLKPALIIPTMHLQNLLTSLEYTVAAAEVSLFAESACSPTP